MEITDIVSTLVAIPWDGEAAVTSMKKGERGQTLLQLFGNCSAPSVFSISSASSAAHTRYF